jgi:hypothetical protein
MRKLWLERTGIGCVALFALGVPLLLGLIGYLAISDDGIALFADDPTREVRLWMVKEPRNIGIALTTVSRASSTANDPANNTCIRTHFNYLKISRGVGFERTSEFCRCYENKAGKWVMTGAACART